MAEIEETPEDLFFSRRQAIHMILAGAGGACSVSALSGCETIEEDPGPAVSELPIAKPRGTITERASNGAIHVEQDRLEMLPVDIRFCLVFCVHFL